MNELKRLLDNFNGEIYNLCYEVLVTVKDQVAAFEYVCKNLEEYPDVGTILIEDYFSKDEIEEYESIYKDTVRGLLNTTIKKCNFGLIEVEQFYKSLWESYCTIFSTEKEKAYAFYFTLTSKSIPYQYLGKPLSMSNEQFKILTEKNKTSIDKISYIYRSRYSQRTERASLLLNCIDEIEDIESKVVVLAHAISIFNQSSRSKEGIEALIRQIDKKIEELEAEETLKED